MPIEHRAASRIAYVLVTGGAALPVVAQTRASGPASSVPPDNAAPIDPVQWFVAGVAAGVILTIAWIKIRGASHKATPA